MKNITHKKGDSERERERESVVIDRRLYVEMIAKTRMCFLSTPLSSYMEVPLPESLRHCRHAFLCA